MSLEDRMLTGDVQDYERRLNKVSVASFTPLLKSVDELIRHRAYSVAHIGKHALVDHANPDPVMYSRDLEGEEQRWQKTDRYLKFLEFAMSNLQSIIEEGEK